MSIEVVVLGAAGRTGRLIVAEALRAGHHVTAAVRDPGSIEPVPGLRVERADIRDPDSLRAALRGQDAVVCAIGPAGRKAGNLYSDGARAVVPAMRATGVTRLLAITSVGVRSDDPHHAWWYRHLIRPIGADLYADMARMEDTIRDSDLDWTFVRPTYLRDGEPTGTCRATDNSTPKGGWRVTRADVAHFIVEELTAHRWSHQSPSLAE
ncbi:NAD(P)-dependent oxidoreductase [Actinoplanes couchii]|uniref:NADH-flavin reductase n=1 Tax=Actinoplanes couchii TaxID=403638 RepID=A0ABQ3XPB2_9ACTN|nr:SDR family oxidoreductase [Actinoplanes couchii]MDR6315857.1 putative NADH-flavin reductase [Actinoplanes couchii]GID60346.1 NADH-flavin reductase [Actinoplanes couchii]